MNSCFLRLDRIFQHVVTKIFHSSFREFSPLNLHSQMFFLKIFGLAVPGAKILIVWQRCVETEISFNNYCLGYDNITCYRKWILMTLILTPLWGWHLFQDEKNFDSLTFRQLLPSWLSLNLSITFYDIFMTNTCKTNDVLHLYLHFPLTLLSKFNHDNTRNADVWSTASRSL